MTSTFTLLVNEYDANQAYQMLEDGYDQNGELQGQNQTLFLYKVPPLDYQGEDIILNFKLTTLSGTKPNMYVRFCKESKDPKKKCTQNITRAMLGDGQNDFTRAERIDNDLSLVIDHDERICQSQYNGECYYTVVLLGEAKESELSQFRLQV